MFCGANQAELLSAPNKSRHKSKFGTSSQQSFICPTVRHNVTIHCHKCDDSLIRCRRFTTEMKVIKPKFSSDTNDMFRRNLVKYDSIKFGEIGLYVTFKQPFSLIQTECFRVLFIFLGIEKAEKKQQFFICLNDILIMS